MSKLPPAMVPDAVLAALATEAQNQVRTGILFLYETHRLLTEFRHAGIEAAVLKGGPLGILAYGSSSIRHSKDIDLLVDPSRVTETGAMLMQLGYTRLVPPEAWSQDQVSDFRVLRSHFEFFNPQTGAQVELHWRLAANSHFGVQFPPTNTWRGVNVGGGLSIPMLAHPDLVEYLCVHGASHAWSRLKWLADVAALLRLHPELIEILRQRGTANGTSRAIDQALVLCHRFYALSLPANFTCSLPVRLLCGIAEDAMTTGGGAGEISDYRWRNTKVHLSRFLLNFHSRYLMSELRGELLLPPAWTGVTPRRGRKVMHQMRRVWERFRK